MKYKTIEIEEGNHYLFSISTPTKASKDFKENVKDQLREGIKEIGFRDTRHKVIFSIQEDFEPSGEIAIEPMGGDKRYLLFGIIGGSISGEKGQEIMRETAEAIDFLIDKESKTLIKFILLVDCEINYTSIKGGSSWGEPATINVGRSRWEEPGGSTTRRGYID